MGLGKSKPKKSESVSAAGRSSTAWGDADGQSSRGRSQNQARVARPNLQQFKSSSAPSSRVNGNVRSNNGASNGGRSGHSSNNNKEWAEQTNTSYNLLDGTVSHAAADDFRTVQIADHDGGGRRRLSGGGGGGADKFSNFHGMMDFRKEEGNGQQRRNGGVAPVHAPKNSNPTSRNPRVQGSDSIGKFEILPRSSSIKHMCSLGRYL